ncbi:MAG: Cof-type HAD-IIB family hydrolase [Lachnospiraceae bacterium]|nr:Cof-type HAD-IIB family hydrolase [Lachnospiraceae bacterium]
MVKCVFFDVDGTLLSHKTGFIPKSTVQALEQLRQSGIRTVMATGRHRLELEELSLGGLAFDGYITLNGQLIYNEKWELLHSHPIVGESKNCLIELFEKKEIPLILVEQDAYYINFVNDYVRQVQKDIYSSIPCVGSYHGGDIFLAMAYGDEAAGVEFEKRLVGLRVTRWHDRAVDILPVDGSKVQGIAYYLGQNDISPEETMAFGDSENDIEMLEFVRIGIAMGNATDDVKHAADHVTDDIDEDGIWKALVKLGIVH